MIRRMQILPPTTLRLVLTLCATGVALASGGQRPAIVAAALGALWVVLFHQRARPAIGPTNAQLRRIDAANAREAEDEYAASGLGEQEYERLLGDLLDLNKQDVTVLIGAGRWRPLAKLSGPLRPGQRVHVEGEPERLAFAIHDRRTMFFLDPQRFERGNAHYERLEDGALFIEDADGVTVRISQTVTATRKA